MPTSITPRTQTPEYHILLTGGDGKRYGLIVDLRTMQTMGSSPSTVLASGGGARFGDWEPNHTHFPQRDWRGGRGQEDGSLDQTRFFDSRNAWTMTPGCIFPAPMFWFGQGFRQAETNLDADTTWVRLIGNSRYLAVSFSASASGTRTRISFWVRRRGFPGTLTISLAQNSSGVPGTTLQSTTLSNQDFPDVTDEWKVVEISSQSVSSGTTYFIVFSGSSSDTDPNHWEIGCKTSGGLASSDGSAWSSGACPYFRITDADTTGRRWKFFELEGALYAVSIYDSGANSEIYINGDRGTATGGSSSTLVCSAKSWSTDVWAGAWVKIIAGSGQGQYRKISSNSGTTLTVETDWDVAPASGSRFVIYGTPVWTTECIGTHGLGAVRDVAVGGAIAYFAQGPSTYVRRMRNNGNSHDWQSESIYADLCHCFSDQAEGPMLYYAINASGEVRRAAIPSSWDALTYKATVPVAAPTYPFTNLLDYNMSVWAMRPDGAWAISADRAIRLNVGLDALPYETNGAAACAHKLFLYFSWAHSIERLYSGTLDDMGLWRDGGLPSNRSGAVSDMIGALSWLFVTVDAGPGTSALFVHNEYGWHEILRGMETGKRMRGLYWQACPGRAARLWVDYGGEMLFLDMPHNTLNPLRDPGFKYRPGCEIVYSTVDMQVASLPKFWKGLVVTADNLGDGAAVALDYKVDNDINDDASEWTVAGETRTSPEGEIGIHRGNVRKIRLRLRLENERATSPAIVRATTLKGFGRTPVKRQWNLRVKSASLMRTMTGNLAVSPDELYDWLFEQCQQAGGVRMRTIWSSADDVWVQVEPPTIVHKFINAITKSWGGTFVLVIREA